MHVTITRKTLLHNPKVSMKVQQLARKNNIPVTIGRFK